MKGIIGRKVGMSRIFDDKGEVVPVTVIEVGPCPVVEVRTADKNGYSAIQIGFTLLLAWQPLPGAPGRVSVKGSAAYIDEDNAAGDRGAVVSPPVWLDFSRVPVMVFDGMYPGDRWALLVRFPRMPAAGTLLLFGPSRNAGTVEVDLRRTIDAAARKAKVASPAAASGLVPAELILMTVGEGSRLTFLREHVEIVYRGGK